MKIKTPIQFETFNDGTVRLYETDDNDNIIEENKHTFRFGEEKVGIKRYFEALQNDIQIEKVIHIQKRKDFKYRTDYAAVINDTRYKIEQIQFDNNRNPAVVILSLSQRGLYEGEDYGF